MILNCLLVDDDQTSRLVIKKFIEQTDFLHLAEEAESSVAASNILLNEKNSDIDLVFMDIQMPEMTGMELVKNLNNAYPVIFITSNKDHALEAFEDNVLDYLVKPVDYSRFLKAVKKALEAREKELKYAEQENHILVKSDSKYVRISYSELMYVEALADYVIFNTTKGKYIVHHTMKGIEKKLPFSSFSRVHRSYIVNRNQINYIEDLTVSIGTKMIPIGASYREKFLEKLNQI
ncbi:LytTR family DNA-binding domain-containing protein [Marinoscillum sp. MHG1-6]|uniref:LytR/AlgR family response regulator transcription factor n=1 Tax=Marinoscillum sp. MHG1-6 TaxID=2959627 RepID=UPI00215706F1|nr:LytTR family DNA-binding domain-containing protein [Marinoscillum sp. MHG1-6]